MSRAPAVVIFDVEGTLINCVPLVIESWRATLHEAGYHFSRQELHPYSGMDGEWMLERLLPQESQDTRKQLLQEQARRYRADFLRHASPFAGVGRLFQCLKGWGVAIGLATTCKKDELAVYDEHLQLRRLADAVVCGEAVQHGKPDPALLLHCMTALDIGSASSAMYVGDTPYDAMAAKAAGMRRAGVLTGGFSPQALREAGCEQVYDRVTALERLWQNEGNLPLRGMRSSANPTTSRST